VVGRYLVQGVDVWLNTPRRPLEACGTSGMKAAFNGALNLSIMDGWWDEAGSPRTGWCIGRGEDYQDLEYQDRIEAGALYELLEREVVPLFYDRTADSLPRGWIALMKSAMGELCPVFNTNRMVHDYTITAYRSVQERSARLEANGHRRARELSRWRERVGQAWSGVQIVRVETDLPPATRVGADLEVRAWVRIGKLTPADLAVQVYIGKVDEGRQIVGATTVPMVPEGEMGDEPGREAGDEPASKPASVAAGDGVLFKACIPCRTSGTHGFTVRVIPRHEDLAHPHATGLILWAS
jgi:starch phosphorylase